MIFIFTNNTSNRIITGEKFYLEKWDGKSWKRVIPTTTAIFNDIGYIVDSLQSRNIETNISFYYPDIGKGKYRVYKHYFFYKDRPITNDEIYWNYSEFSIE